VSYVLLVSIGLAIAGLVFSWLKFYADIGETERCPDGVSLLLSHVSYSGNPGSLGLNITLQNRGRFDVDGYVIRINNKTNSKVGVIELNRTFEKIIPGNFSSQNFSSVKLSKHNRVCFLEVQPLIRYENNRTLFCAQVSTRKIDC
jgi:hypothetical protein